MSIFERLSPQDYRETSEETTDYNCLAWALHDDESIWDPIMPGAYWPEHIPRGKTPSHFIALFEDEGFSECTSDDHEPGFEKIALYHRDNRSTHVARQKENGVWTSKMGEDADIDHYSLDCLRPIYGDIYMILKRRG